jgi:hypothetical protein
MYTMNKRTVVVLAAGISLPLLLAGPASADIPSGTELPGGVSSPFCSFPLLITDVRNHRQSTTTTLPDGSTVVRITGNLVQKMTNESTGKSVVVNVSGPTTDITSPDGTHDTFVGTGRNLFIFGRGGQRNTGEPPVVLTSGRVAATVTINTATGVGTAQTFRLRGRQDNVCELLAH